MATLVVNCGTSESDWQNGKQASPRQSEWAHAKLLATLITFARYAEERAPFAVRWRRSPLTLAEVASP